MAGDSYRKRTERKHCKCFICGSVDNLIAKYPKLHKYNKKLQKQVRFNERNNCAPQKEPENGDKYNYQKIYASMAQMYGNYKSSSTDFGDISKLTNWILDSGATCHMKPQLSDFIPGLLEDTDKFILKLRMDMTSRRSKKD